MQLASFVTGLVGHPGTQCRYANPQSMDQALKIALSVQEAESQEKISECFYANFNRSVRLMSKSPIEHTVSTRSNNPRPTHVQSVAREISVIKLPVVLISQ